MGPRTTPHALRPTAATRIASDSASSCAGIGVADHRTGTAMGDQNGIRLIVVASWPLGSLRMPKNDRYGTISTSDTGVCACRASCSVLEIAPTAANTAAYRK